MSAGELNNTISSLTGADFVNAFQVAAQAHFNHLCYEDASSGQYDLPYNPADTLRAEGITRDKLAAMPLTEKARIGETVLTGLLNNQDAVRQVDELVDPWQTAIDAKDTLMTIASRLRGRLVRVQALFPDNYPIQSERRRIGSGVSTIEELDEAEGRFWRVAWNERGRPWMYFGKKWCSYFSALVVDLDDTKNYKPLVSVEVLD